MDAKSLPQLTNLQSPSVVVAKLINAKRGKSPPIDAFLTSLLKSCCDVFAQLIARLVELSFRSGLFPTRYKLAGVTPLLKRKDLDCDNPAN